MKREFVIYSDGACSGNPGPAGVGVVIQADGKTIAEISQPIGSATNNVAEYKALIVALHEARKLQADELIVHTDSELLYHQLKGTYKVKNENIKPLFDELYKLAQGFSKIEMRHIPREKNAQADGLAKKAIKKNKQTKVVASKFIFGEESPSSKG